MATSSEVKAGLDAVAGIISEQRQVMLKVKSNAQIASDSLAALASDYADVVSTIQAYGTSNAFEALAKAELAKLTAEFTALKGKSDAVAAVDLNS
jgi:hypothetical protein